MGKALIDMTSGQVVGWFRWDDPSTQPEFDTSRHKVVSADQPPDRRTRRWDGAAGLRNASPAEVRHFDDELADAEVDSLLTRTDDDRDRVALHAIFKVIADNVGMPLDRIHAEFRQAYRTARAVNLKDDPTVTRS